MLHTIGLLNLVLFVQKWDPDKQFENDIITQNQNALLIKQELMKPDN